MRGRKKLPIAAIAVLLVGVLANLALNAATAQSRYPGWLDVIRARSWQSLGVFVAAMVGLTWVAAPRRKSKKRDLRKVAALLADAVEMQWESETKRRRIFNPYALPVKWVAAEPDLFTPWSVIVKQAKGSPGVSAELAATWAAGPGELTGSDKDLTVRFRTVPTRLLVVLGEPGAGKTILLVRFILELLSPERRQPGGPVPMLMPLASWNPTIQDLHSWMVQWLAADPAGLNRLTPDAPGMARALLNAGLILPILDGFDEIPDELRRTAIGKINEAPIPRSGLILAARIEAYRDAVNGHDGSQVWQGAAGIELCPLEASVVADYLKEASDNPEVAERWDAVTRTLGTDNPPPVAQVLTTPLMVTLARAIYNPRDKESAESVQHHPAELLNRALFKDKDDVRTYLLDKFIWAAYRPYHDPAHLPRSHEWDYAHAKRWLVFLARNQQEREQGNPDIAWWRLRKAAPKHLVAGVLAAGLGFVAAIGYPFVGFGVGVTAGLPVGLAVRKLFPLGESKLFPALERGIVRGLFGGLAGGVAASIIATVVLPSGTDHYGLGAHLAAGLAVGIAVSVLGTLVAGLAAGFVGGIALTFYENAAIFGWHQTSANAISHVMNGIGIGIAAIVTVDLANRRAVPSHGLRWSLVWMACGSGCGLIIGGIALVQLGSATGLAVVIAAPIAGALTGAVAGAVESDPAGTAPLAVVLQRDRGAFLRSWLVFGAALGLATGIVSSISPGPAGHPNGVQFGIGTGLTNVVVPGLGLAFIQALWGTFSIARCWLALKGQLPWRLMTFMHDAYERGVFRQVGAVYQFRHIDLQRRIAGWPAEPPTGAAPTTKASQTGVPRDADGPDKSAEAETQER